MPKLLFSALHRPNRSPSQRYRFDQFMQHFKQQGFEIDYAYLLNKQDDINFYQKSGVWSKALIAFKSIFKRLLELPKLNQYDVILVQRESIMLGSSWFEKQYAKSNARFIYDFDDSIWLPNISEQNKKFAFLKRPEKTNEIIALADLVICGNQHLANHALQFNPNVEVIPTVIDTDYYQPKQYQLNQPICIGWSGSPTTIQHFKAVLLVLERLHKKYGSAITFKVIGDPNFEHEPLKMKGRAWNSSTEMEDLQGIDIGIMPLPNDEWSKGKCGAKGLQYMAAGVCTIMSAVGVNSSIIQDKENGFLANTIDDFETIIESLINHKEQLPKVGMAGRQTIEKHYSINAWKQQYTQFLLGNN